ncbi:hypothetical protein [Erythrobacter sp.]|jgi:hypothetical protein|uniref:hypothetical protein n=1 Tax=Erythrobacter sp. TaxID=1042 RepID=UPI002E9B440A|nr:hypothetical protein [Erythrobacter sp.]
MSSELDDIMLAILKGIQSDVGSIKREITSLDARMSSMEDHMRGLMTSVYSMQADMSDLKRRVDRIEGRLGLLDPEEA